VKRRGARFRELLKWTLPSPPLPPWRDGEFLAQLVEIGDEILGLGIGQLSFLRGCSEGSSSAGSAKGSSGSGSGKRYTSVPMGTGTTRSGADLPWRCRKEPRPPGLALRIGSKKRLASWSVCVSARRITFSLVTAVTAVGTALGDEFLAAEAGGAIPAVTRLRMNPDSIDEHAVRISEGAGKVPPFSAPIASHPKSSSAWRRPASPILRPGRGSAMSRFTLAARAAAKTSGSVASKGLSVIWRSGTRWPVSPSTTTSLIPPTALATTGVPQAMASRLMIPKGS